MTSEEDQQLARLRAAFTAPDIAPAPHSCPPPETLWSAVRGELPPNQLRELIDHTTLCAACAEDWRLAAELGRPAVAEVAAPAGKLLQGRFGQWRPLVAAAALAAGLLIAVGVYRAELGVQDPTYREAEGTAIRSLLAPGDSLPRQGAVLRWSPVPGAVSYDVRVSTEDLRVVATAQDQTATELRLPEGALANLPPGSTLLWQVEAIFPDGTRRNSPTFTNVLR